MLTEACLARAGHTATAAGHLLVILGGSLRDASQRDTLDVLVIDLRTLSLVEPQLSGTPPKARQKHAAVLVAPPAEGTALQDALREAVGSMHCTSASALGDTAAAAGPGAAGQSSQSGSTTSGATSGTSSSSNIRHRDDSASDLEALAAAGTASAPLGRIWPSEGQGAAGRLGLSSASRSSPLLSQPSASSSSAAGAALAGGRSRAIYQPVSSWAGSSSNEGTGGALGACSDSRGDVCPQPSPASSSPRGLSASEVLSSGHLLAVYGGRGPTGVELGGPGVEFLWVSDSGREALWFKAGTRGPEPSPRYKHSMLAVADGQKLVLYGGIGAEVHDEDEETGNPVVYQLDLPSLVWSRHVTAVAAAKRGSKGAGGGAGATPGVRGGGMCCVRRGPEGQEQMVLAGGVWSEASDEICDMVPHVLNLEDFR